MILHNCGIFGSILLSTVCLTLKDEVEAGGWSGKPSTYQRISSNGLTEFPIMTEESLLMFTSGPYQLRLARSYLAELIVADDEVPMRYVKVKPTIIRVDIRSRHSESVKYRVYVDFEPGRNGVEGIKRYYCECKNGARTVGCCAHVATVVSYLSHTRWQPVIRRPADHLTDLFVPQDRESEDETEDQIAGPSRAE